MMASKRTHIEIDPDYEDVSEVQNKRRRVLEEGAKEATKKKIMAIVKKQFEIEVSNKESEILNISQKLEIARCMMDRLRACIIANFYGNQQKASRKNAEQAPLIHPTVRKFIGKAPPGTSLQNSPSEIKQEAPEGDVRTLEFVSERIGKMPTKSQGHLKAAADKLVSEQPDSRTGRFKLKKRIIVGNVSKSIPAEQRDENDQATHKWMVYVRGPKDSPGIDDFVKKVWFFLHPSYRPNDLVEVSEAPFHLTRRGWGEFPVRVQLHFKDHRNKTRDIIHNLKLDRTYTSLQTLGCETIVDIEIEKDIPKVKRERAVSTRVKQEPGTSDSAANTSQRMLVPTEIKTEPADDHDYGMSACLDDAGTSLQCSVEKNIAVISESSISGTRLTLSHGLTSVTGSATLARNSLQTIVSPSIIAQQPLTLIPVGPAFPQNHPHVSKLCPVTPPRNDIMQLQAVSPGVNMRVTSPSRNVILKGFGTVNASNLGGNKAVFGSMPNSLIQVSPTKSPNAKNNFMVPQPVILTNVHGNQSRIQTGLVQTSPQQSLNMNKMVNQSPNSNLIFLKCTDNRGKTYLIPQQIGTNVSSLPKGNNPGQIRVSSPVSHPILLTSSLMNTRAGVRFSGVSSSSQSPVSNASSVQKTKFNSMPPVKQPVENGPILFIKPDNNLSKRLTNAALVKSNFVAPVTSSVKLKMSSNVQVLQSTAQSQSVNVVNLKTGKQTTVCAENQSMIRGQLKVTSQGLIQVHGQLQQQAAKGNQSPVSLIEQSKISINGGISRTSLPSAQTMQQPLILVPTSTNNKLNVLPCKGKSLLNKSISNLQVSQSNGSIVLLNQSNPVTANGNLGKILLSPSGVSNPTDQVKLFINAGSDHHTDSGAEGKNLASKQQNIPANHILIVPVSSKTSVPVVPGQTGANLSNISILESVTASGKNNLSQLSLETKSREKMLIVLQNDKSAKNVTCDNSQGQRAMSSLLGSRSNSPVQAAATYMRETPVMIKSSNSREKQIIIVDKENTLENCARNLNCLDEKKIMIGPKKKRLIKPVVEVKEREIIVAFRPQDFPDMLSLIQAAVKRHPLISPTTDHHLHPYCARSSEEWLSWNVGKRRASEWQRASSTRRFVMSHLEDGRMFKGESLWTVKQILTWCRLHAYSPHYLERPLHPTAIDLQAETSLPSDKQHRNFASVTDSNRIVEEVTSLQDHVTVVESCSEDEIDIISLGSKTCEAKQRVDTPLPYHDIQMLPLSDGASYVEKMTQEIGIRLVPTVVESGYYGTVSHGILYRAMELFMGDILRNTFALKVNMGRYPDAVGIADVYAALNNQPITDFLTNQFLGVEENQGVPKVDR